MTLRQTFLFISIGVAIGYLLGLAIHRDPKPPDETEVLRGQIMQLQNLTDSLSKVNEEIGNEIEQAYLVQDNLRHDSERAKKEMIRAQFKLSQIKFVSLKSDSARTAKLKELYPSMK